MSQDKRMGTAAHPIPPVLKLWQQMISDARPALVITTGTAGGIGPSERLGDTVVSQVVRFDCKKKYKALNRGSNLDPYYCAKALNVQKLATLAQPRMKINADELPKGSSQPKIIAVPNQVSDRNKGIVTTDFFDFDYSKPASGPPSDLTGLGSAVEMGDAVLGLLQRPPIWVAVRNASDPQMDGKLPPAQRVRAAAAIYQKYGYWTTICSAIACWAIVVSNMQGRTVGRAGTRKKGAYKARGPRARARTPRPKKPASKRRAGGRQKGHR
ncbi:MAG: hypothetical protein JOZ77_08050 [Candidatus Eremiobacteraeota bacterium]|nr:hypothetical protein [Candidatus Eremiobacteraeota bacterium]